MKTLSTPYRYEKHLRNKIYAIFDEQDASVSRILMDSMVLYSISSYKFLIKVIPTLFRLS